MYCPYDDITSRLGEPRWWDEYGVPRYCEFGPDEGANIYARQIALAVIQCQGCGREFKVAFSSDGIDAALAERMTLAEAIRERALHYGDPPNIDCCAAGPTMSSVARRVLEFWDRDERPPRRRPELEGIDITPEWAQPDDQ